MCFPADAAGLDRLTFLVKSPDGVPLADLDGVIEVVGGSDARTEAGVGAGNTVEDLRTVYGEPTRIEDTPMAARAARCGPTARSADLSGS